MELIRKPTNAELKLIEVLISLSARAFPENWNAELHVMDMKDGGMGSLLLFPKDFKEKDRQFGEQVSDYRFLDEDGVEVIASLNVDQNGNLFELDMWKTDFSKLLRWPFG